MSRKLQCSNLRTLMFLVIYILFLLAPSSGFVDLSTRFLNAAACRQETLGRCATPADQGSQDASLSLQNQRMFTVLDPSDSRQQSVVEAAATMTQQSCKLLGVRSLGVDYGLVRTGVAVTVGYQPKGLEIISNENATEVIFVVLKQARSEQVQQIVVGLPLHRNGTEALQTKLTRAFATQLACWTYTQLGPSVKVYLWDERYTSKEAAARLRSEDPSRDLRNQLDADAACIILENFYEENGQGAEQVLLPDELQEACHQAWDTLQMEQRNHKLISSIDAPTRRREAMERARKLEESMAQGGTLGSSRKQKKRKKKPRASRGSWTVL